MKPTIYFNSTGYTGNIFFILALVRRELEKQRRVNEYNEMRDRVTNSRNYRTALAVIREYVFLVDLDCRE